MGEVATLALLVLFGLLACLGAALVRIGIDMWLMSPEEWHELRLEAIERKRCALSFTPSTDHVGGGE